MACRGEKHAFVVRETGKLASFSVKMNMYAAGEYDHKIKMRKGRG